MSTIYEIRRDNLRRVIEERSASSVAKACGYASPSYISQMAGRNPTRPITEDNARKFEQGLGLPKGWLDTERDAYGAPATEKSPPPVEKPRTESAIPLTMIDVDRFTMVASMVRDAAKARSMILDKAKFTEIVSIVYEDFAKDEPTLRNLANRLISLVA